MLISKRADPNYSLVALPILGDHFVETKINVSLTTSPGLQPTLRGKGDVRFIIPTGHR